MTLRRMAIGCQWWMTTMNERTPSGWYEDARRRDAGHDEMQARVWGLLRSKEGYSKVSVERPSIENGRIIGFADAASMFRGEQGSIYLLYGVKPVIHSVGSLLRQCEATLRLARREWRPTADIRVIAVVYDDDPKADLFQEYHAFQCWRLAREP